MKNLKHPALALGLCPAVCAATTAWGGLLAGVATVLVFALSECVVCALRNVLPPAGRFPVLLVCASGFAAVCTLLSEAYCPAAYSAAGAFLPLTAVSCLLLDRVPGVLRQESVSHTVLGFLLALFVTGLLCEVLGAGTMCGLPVMPESIQGMAALTAAPGPFLVLAVVLMFARGVTGGEEDAL